MTKTAAAADPRGPCPFQYTTASRYDAMVNCLFVPLPAMDREVEKRIKPRLVSPGRRYVTMEMGYCIAACPRAGCDRPIAFYGIYSRLISTTLPASMRTVVL